jgi:tetratricopeptide (TPR) repeat protein
MQGQSLLRVAQASSQADQPAYARSNLPQQGFQCSPVESWRSGKYLYIRAPKPELYDLSADPGATKDLAQSSKATLDTLASQVQALDNRLGNEPGKETASALTSSEMQKLASLGYVGLQTSGAGANVGTKGTDAKDIIAVANRTLAALRDLDDGKPEKAIPVLRQVLASQPDLYLAQFAMGLALFQQQHYVEAFGFLHKAIELAPESPWAHYTMGLGLMKTGDFQTSGIHLRIAARRLPGFVPLRAPLAEVERHLGTSQDAVRQEGMSKHD